MLTARQPAPDAAPHGTPYATSDTARLTVLEPGPLTTVQDLGRRGYAHLGVSPSGAADRGSLGLANRLVGNPAPTPALECTLGGLSIKLDADRTAALTGAPAPALINGRPVADPRRFRLFEGNVLTVGRPTVGLRTYLALSGGLLVPPVLGGRGYDVLAGHGPRPLQAADTLTVGADRPPPPVPVELAVGPCPAGTATVRFRWGPRHTLFSAEDRNHFIRTGWRVSTECNRVGARLRGGRLNIGDAALASEGMVRGAIQVPPSGEPIVFLSDHPTTGGYPVVGVVTETDLDLVAQATPGTEIRFRPLPGS